MRGAVYVDGFNLYHAIDDLNLNHLKWLNLRALGELIARGHARTIVRVAFCSAYFPGDTGKKARHRFYVQALELAGVQTILGHAVREPMNCADPACGFRWEENREKATDINLALAVAHDLWSGSCDAIFMVTADTDQAATLGYVRDRFPSVRRIVVAPPGRPPSAHLSSLANATIRLEARHLERCLLPGLVQKQGSRAVLRPREYDPPPGWSVPAPPVEYGGVEPHG